MTLISTNRFSPVIALMFQVKKSTDQHFLRFADRRLASQTLSSDRPIL